LLFGDVIKTHFIRRGDEFIADSRNYKSEPVIFGHGLGMVRKDVPEKDGDELTYNMRLAIGSRFRHGQDIFISIGDKAIVSWLNKFPPEDTEHFSGYIN